MSRLASEPTAIFTLTHLLYCMERQGGRERDPGKESERKKELVDRKRERGREGEKERESLEQGGVCGFAGNVWNDLETGHQPTKHLANVRQTQVARDLELLCAFVHSEVEVPANTLDRDRVPVLVVQEAPERHGGVKVRRRTFA